jgi:molybdopterin-biosynthesis enzyme MoeA-like protein
MPKTAGIILIGNEILSGKIADANAASCARSAWTCAGSP